MFENDGKIKEVRGLDKAKSLLENDLLVKDVGKDTLERICDRLDSMKK